MGEARPPNGFWCHAKIRIFSFGDIFKRQSKKNTKSKMTNNEKVT